MTLTDLLAQLQLAQAAAANAKGDAVEKADLNIAVLTIQRQIQFAGYDALTKLDTVTVPDLSNLPGLVADLHKALQSEQNFNSILGRILSIAKTGLGPIGIALPV